MKIFLPLVDVVCFRVDGDEEMCFTVGEFCELMKDKEKSEMFVLKVWKTYGKHSEEFLFCIQGLVWWACNKYLWNDVNEELFNEVYLEVLDRVDSYDESKGKFLNYLHMVIRGKLTKELHKQRMQGRVFVDVDMDVGNRVDFMNIEDVGCFLEWKHGLWLEYEDGDKYDERYLVVVLSLAKLLKIDFKIMGYLFQKFGIDVLYFFYMLAGKRLSVWSCKRFSEVLEQILYRYEGREIKSQYIKNVVDGVKEFLKKNEGVRVWRSLDKE